jgi:hypothetical protein
MIIVRIFSYLNLFIAVAVGGHAGRPGGDCRDFGLSRAEPGACSPVVDGEVEVEQEKPIPGRTTEPPRTAARGPRRATK